MPNPEPEKTLISELRLLRAENGGWIVEDTRNGPSSGYLQAKRPIMLGAYCTLDDMLVELESILAEQELVSFDLSVKLPKETQPEPIDPAFANHADLSEQTKRWTGEVRKTFAHQHGDLNP